MGSAPRQVQVRTIDLDGKDAGKPASASQGLLPPLTEPSPGLWTALSFDDQLYVAARAGGKILYSQPGSSGWKSLGAAPAGPGWLQLFSPHSIKLWAEWCTVNRGPARAQVRQTRDSVD